MINDILVASEDLLKRIEKIGKFSIKYGVSPYRELIRIRDGLKELAGSIPDAETPENQEQLTRSELKRRLNGEAFSLEQSLTPRHYDFETIVSMYGIPKPDIDGLKDWLLANRDETLEIIERLYQTKNVQNYELRLQGDIPSIRRQAEEFATVHIQKYHKILGEFLQDLTQVGEFLRDINTVPTTEERSYFNALTNTLAISIPRVCFATEDRSLRIREEYLITCYGHEGMGHALNQVVTENNGLPYFLTKENTLTAATRESIAQFYQDVILDDLKNSPETQRDLGIQHKFGEIYQEAKDISQLQEYQSKLLQYGITVLANKDLGHPQDPATLRKKVDLLHAVALEPTYALHCVEQHRYNFDSQGNLSSQLVGELKYCAQPVRRALDEFAKQGIHYGGDERSKIDATLLKGFWTPMGFVDNARLKAKEK